MPNGLFSIETRAGDPISTGKLKLVPFAQVFQLRFPLFNGGLVWNRPVSVLAIAQPTLCWFEASWILLPDMVAMETAIAEKISTNIIEIMSTVPW